MYDIPAFGNHLPVKVRFGPGVADTLPDVLVELGATRVFLMVDEGIEQHNPAVAKLLDDLIDRTRTRRHPVRQTGGRTDHRHGGCRHRARWWPQGRPRWWPSAEGR